MKNSRKAKYRVLGTTEDLLWQSSSFLEQLTNSTEMEGTSIYPLFPLMMLRSQYPCISKQVRESTGKNL